LAISRSCRSAICAASLSSPASGTIMQRR
jgi:hypothetical protein